MKISLSLLLCATAVSASAQTPGPGDPEYDCNYYCGNIISMARIQPSTVYCFSKQFITNINNCQACANTYNVWGTYGAGVTAAAAACGIKVSLQPSGNTIVTMTVTANPSAASAVGGAGGGFASTSADFTPGVNGSATSTVRSTTSFMSQTTGSTTTSSRTTSSSSQAGLIPAIQTSAAAVRNVVQGAFVAFGMLGLFL